MPMFSVGSAAAFAVTTSGSQTITGTKTFLAASASTVPVIVRGVAGQTANLLEVYDSVGTLVSAISPTGSIGGIGPDDINALVWTQ